MLDKYAFVLQDSSDDGDGDDSTMKTPAASK